ncbi:MAG: hypothetical protein LBQ76_08785 [Candidatus Fibromonas sp.]|jgi:hypothetical protein|nr:hypothetical protein [Candidatus Fibromonas sp.]
MGCGDQCVKYQDVAVVKNMRYYSSYTDIDSVVMKTNDSITGCGDPRYGAIVGSKTHRVKFPINAHIQLFSQGGLWKEFSLEMNKNTVLKIYDISGCSNPGLLYTDNVESAKENNRFIDSSFMDDYCWLIEKMDESYDDEDRCIEWDEGGKVELCRGL